MTVHSSMIADYHIHTRMCRHAEGEPREYAERAAELGMAEMGFADHLPFLGGWEPRYDLTDDWAMRVDELDEYCAVVQDLAREFAPGLRIRLGIEADFIPDTLDDTAAVLEQYPFEYVIGSVHIVGDRFGFDHPEMAGRLDGYGIDRIHLESLELTRQLAGTGLFDVAGHFDHARKFGPPTDPEAVAGAARAALRAVAAAGMCVELNTGGLRKPIGETFPGTALLAEARELGIPLVFGSDAHKPLDVGHGFDRAVALALAAGYRELWPLPRDGREPLPLEAPA
jgi:histidinol-phosphatase (PHP family)